MSFPKNIFLHPAYTSFKIRESFFKYKIEYKYLPEEIDPTKFILQMDALWFLKGYSGQSIFMVPKGNPHSKRFDYDSAYYQSWVGTYYINALTPKTFKNSLEKVKSLTECAVIDQSAWLKVFGARNIKTELDLNSIKLLEKRQIGDFTQEIYYGEITSFVDDYIGNKKPIKIIENLSTSLAEIYNNKKIDRRLLLPDDNPTLFSEIKLFGFISVIQISKSKFIVTYVCGDVINKDKLFDDLYKIISNLSLN